MSSVTNFNAAEQTAGALLEGFGRKCTGRIEADHPALAWRRAGMMELTGEANGSPLVFPHAVASVADGAYAALKQVAGPDARMADMAGSTLLGERARRRGFKRRGAVSPNGSCHLFSVSDGMIALNMARLEDRDCLPAWLEDDDAADLERLPALLGQHRLAPLLTRGAELGLAIAAAEPAKPRPWVRVDRLAAPHRPAEAFRILDLSSLWAGPLCGSLLVKAGGACIKVEDPARPDSVAVDPGFYDLLNGEKKKELISLGCPDGKRRLGELIADADIVIEGSRPRALRALGINAEEAVRQGEGKVWVRITGHGDTGADADRAAFGDDAAVAGGTIHAMMQAWGRPVFAGDALGDPLTGLFAALAALCAHQAGGGVLVALSLAGSVAWAIEREGLRDRHAIQSRARLWQRRAEVDVAPLYPLR